jgi:hypothetical protein
MIRSATCYGGHRSLRFHHHPAILVVRELFEGSLTATTFLPEYMSHAETIINHRDRSERLLGV